MTEANKFFRENFATVVGRHSLGFFENVPARKSTMGLAGSHRSKSGAPQYVKFMWCKSDETPLKLG